MGPKDIIESALQGADMVVQMYLKDVPDSAWIKRPHPGCNHLNWQVGHLIVSEHQMIEGSVPGSMPPLPEGMVEMYSKEKSVVDDPAHFASPQTLKDQMLAQRNGTLAALKNLSEATLEQPAAEKIRSYCPQVADAFMMQSTHWLMHSGQWVILRREFGLPVVM